jgi:hypothetical protein
MKRVVLEFFKFAGISRSWGSSSVWTDMRYKASAATITAVSIGGTWSVTMRRRISRVSLRGKMLESIDGTLSRCCDSCDVHHAQQISPVEADD